MNLADLIELMAWRALKRSAQASVAKVTQEILSKCCAGKKLLVY